ncbi:hypothetical protein COCSUDRAFT_40248 [Coccomyxa subellipsoidea C-169]|uniref:Uncharacterized protein n=1 Tax=Coccomyxa subellipsoidea (strain C-169) TaxID=574566 RepID=I0Z618_COCSC|nr:hypothetical protein COCSUDRAFT_40248 [Coccomyxa subellipsoidea C-169]EIE26087.1 hypothetical protein COCSUDRAFT_40248 [Coccomyxa subellipsoidea C-169]|eukprot:XP_005650631.1 hypothetical protein COCSUDRAFT_40248 [Coccomyxa subellipsoidea C-169]
MERTISTTTATGTGEAGARRRRNPGQSGVGTGREKQSGSTAAERKTRRGILLRIGGETGTAKRNNEPEGAGARSVKEQGSTARPRAAGAEMVTAAEAEGRTVGVTGTQMLGKVDTYDIARQPGMLIAADPTVSCPGRSTGGQTDGMTGAQRSTIGQIAGGRAVARGAPVAATGAIAGTEISGRHERDRGGRLLEETAAGHTEGGVESSHRSRLSRSVKEMAEAKEAPSTLEYDATMDFFSPQFDAAKALSTPGLLPPNPKVLPLDNISKCRAILPAELPESRAAKMAVNPKRRRSQAAQAALERARARTATVRSRQEAALAAERPPALQRVAAAVPEGPLSLLRKCCFLRGFDKYMNLILWETDEHYTVRLRVERSKVVGVPAREKADPAEDSPQQGNKKRGKMENSRLIWKQEKRVRHLQQVLLRGSSIVLVSLVPVEPNH